MASAKAAFADVDLQPNSETLDPEARSGPLHHCLFDVDQTVFCSSSNYCPNAGELLLHGLLEGARISWSGRAAGIQHIEVTRCRSDVLAVDWLDANTAILGHRNGTVQLFVSPHCFQQSLSSTADSNSRTYALKAAPCVSNIQVRSTSSNV